MSKPAKKRSRVAGAAAMVVCLLTAVAALGGVGAAQSAISSADKAYGKKVTVCHKGKKTISIGKAALPAHLRHGDTVGTCAAAKAKKAKAAKAAKAKAAKVAKAKAAKAKAEEAKAAAEKKQQDKSSEKGENPGKGKGKGGKG